LFGERTKFSYFIHLFFSGKEKNKRNRKVNRKEFLLSPARKQYCESIRRALTITDGSYEGSDELRNAGVNYGELKVK